MTLGYIKKTNKTQIRVSIKEFETNDGLRNSLINNGILQRESSKYKYYLMDGNLLELKEDEKLKRLGLISWKNMDKEKCYEIIENCKEELKRVVDECNGTDGNSTYLALQLIRDMDRLKKCISIDIKID